VLASEPVLLSTACPKCPLPLQRLVRKLLSKRPAQRYQSAREVRKALEQLHARLRCQQIGSRTIKGEYDNASLGVL
jgi:hypothetical protein